MFGIQLETVFYTLSHDSGRFPPGLLDPFLKQITKQISMSWLQKELNELKVDTRIQSVLDKSHLCMV